MVKNVKGGSSHKGQARKHVMSSSNNNYKTRIAEDVCEIYAIVTALLGNGMCHVKDIEGKQYLCFIRGKFKGRGKRDNTITRDKWVLVGIRDFETNNDKKKLPKCDLLEVYSDADKEKLKSQVKINWSLLSDTNTNQSSHDDFVFADEKQNEYENIISNHDINIHKTTISFNDDNQLSHIEQHIDIDDI